MTLTPAGEDAAANHQKFFIVALFLTVLGISFYVVSSYLLNIVYIY